MVASSVSVRWVSSPVCSITYRARPAHHSIRQLALHLRKDDIELVILALCLQMNCIQIAEYIQEIDLDGLLFYWKTYY